MIALHDRIRVHVRGEWIAVEVTRLPVVCAMCDDTHTMTLRRANGDEQRVMCTACPTPCERCRVGGDGPYCATPRCDCDCHGGALLMRGTWSGHSDDGRLVTWDASHDVEAVAAQVTPSGVLAVPMHDLTVACAFGWGSLGPEECQRAALEGALAGWRMRALLSEDRRRHDAHAEMKAHAELLALLFDSENEVELAKHWGAELAEQLAAVRVLWEGERRAFAQLEARLLEWRALAEQLPRLRDRLAIAEHQHELARDVLRAAAGTVEGGTHTDRLSRAIDRWHAAGRPGLGGER